MYCPQCDRAGVDFNSVAVSGPKRAYTLDSDGPIDPTYISNSATVVNVCKTCGCQTLFSSKQDFAAAFAAAEAESKKSDFRWKALCIVSGVAGLLGGFWATGQEAHPGSDMENAGQIGTFIFGLLLVGIGTFVVGAIFLALSEDS